jgi:hypothetical protein
MKFMASPMPIRMPIPTSPRLRHPTMVMMMLMMSFRQFGQRLMIAIRQPKLRRPNFEQIIARLLELCHFPICLIQNLHDVLNEQRIDQVLLERTFLE